MLNLSRAGKTLIIVFVTVFALGFTVKLLERPRFIYVQDPNCIPSAREIQQRLEDLGNPRYDPNGVDGYIGKDSRKAWDNYVCDRFAKGE